jgi:hypothetical protein
MAAMSPDGAYVRVKGLPYSATAETLREFFAPAVQLELADIALRHNAAGEACVRVKAAELAAALALDKQTVGR